MARDFIKIDRTTVTATHAALLIDYVRALRASYDLGKRVKGIMDHNNDGTVFTDVEALFGLPSGKGQTVYDLINAASGGADAKALTETVG